jgi:hypothetical protein
MKRAEGSGRRGGVVDITDPLRSAEGMTSFGFAFWVHYLIDTLDAMTPDMFAGTDILRGSTLLTSGTALRHSLPKSLFIA